MKKTAAASKTLLWLALPHYYIFLHYDILRHILDITTTRINITSQSFPVVPTVALGDHGQPDISSDLPSCHFATDHLRLRRRLGEDRRGHREPRLSDTGLRSWDGNHQVGPSKGRMLATTTTKNACHVLRILCVLSCKFNVYNNTIMCIVVYVFITFNMFVIFGDVSSKFGPHPQTIQ